MMLDKLVIALVAPLGTGLALGFLALCCCALGRRGSASWLGFVSLSWVLIFSVPVVSHLLRARVESAYPYIAPAAQHSAAVAVVLGGGMEPPERPAGPANLRAAADRVVHAAALYHAGKASKLLLSGGHNAATSAQPEAQVMAALLHRLGVPQSALMLEEASRNTRENAEYSRVLLDALGVDEILLVTSALHMRRSVARFEAVGLRVIPAATDHEARRRFSAVDWLPHADALDGSGRAIKEIVGYWSGR
jgi:uncharacterized SAM-binding protein YcdF (DUF218 family)